MLYTTLQTQMTGGTQVTANEGETPDGEGLLHPETWTSNDKGQLMLVEG